MKNKHDIRLFIALTWVISFAFIWCFFYLLLPRHKFKEQLDIIEKHVIESRWDEARVSMDKLKEIYEGNRTIIQINNGTEAFVTFDSMIGQLDDAIENKQELAGEFIGGLRNYTDFVMKAFAGP
ncbi:hypothetical protein [Clostridium folliculivorans]|uniref:DUF4363 family protein n=1 Tax=Clostridium folliculivorans TaxID=2886038 RepID=A0A9W5XYW9_9CLOT|nr:hypothetical protein [Clostridium folliculivorans]GKU23487.1 hypothetical protein CFOLD11_03130 [Clostridium folliculivorans]GKU29603.1 hypothetical protein CFB3_17100 [Clostridium folliculivorans]